MFLFCVDGGGEGALGFHQLLGGGLINVSDFEALLAYVQNVNKSYCHCELLSVCRSQQCSMCRWGGVGVWVGEEGSGRDLVSIVSNLDSVINV